MDRSEPAFVPGWLKNINSKSSNASNNASSTASQSDDNTITVLGRNRILTSIIDNDSPRSSKSMGRTSPPLPNRTSNSNGSLTHVKDHPYSSFGRSRDKDRDRGRSRDLSDFYDKGGPFLKDHWERRDTSRRSYSMVPGKRNEVYPRRDLNGVMGSKSNGGSTVGRFQKVSFERDFPSLGVDERLGGNENTKVASPVQSLPMGNSVVIGGDGWTSALADVPVIIGGNAVGGISSVHQSAPASLIVGAPMVSTGLNMAETIAQAPPPAHTVPQISAETQRLKELAIRKSMQLIPMIPSMPKHSNKTHVNQSLRAPTRSDVLNTGKLILPKVARDRNGILPTSKDISSPATNNPASAVPSTAFALPTTLGNPNNKKPKSLSPLKEKKATFSQNQSRHDFFNLMRKKASNLPSAAPDLSPKSTVSDGSCEPISEVTTSLDSLKTDDLVCNGNACEESKVYHNDDEKHLILIEDAFAEDKVEALIRLLGWDDSHDGQVECLTEEEISAYHKENRHLISSSKLPLLPESNVSNFDSGSSGLGNFDSGSSDLSSSDSDSEA